MTADRSPANPTDASGPPRHVIATEAKLRALYRQPSEGALKKNASRLDRHGRRFIELSPFLCMATMGPDGLGDVTPRGGPPGFVHVLDATHVALPDRPGNNRLDALANLVHRPGVGLLFFIPGFDDTLRVNGIAQITTDPELMQRFVVQDRLPLSVIVTEVKEAYLHCTKALRRAELWRPESRVDRTTFATAGEIYRDVIADGGATIDVAALDAALEDDARNRLY
jgi:PPOX class probable FMN-dependent enzyme